MRNNNITIEDLWQSKTSQIPNLSEIYNLADKAKRKLLFRTIIINVTYMLTTAFILAIWVNYNPKLLSTKIGICLSILAILSFVLAQNRMLPYLKKENDNINLNDYLIQLKELRKKEHFMQTTMLNIYFAMLSLGILLYMYEYVAKTPLSILLTYGPTIGWFVFNWFYLRPKTLKKQQIKTNELISKFENLQKQIAEN